MAGSAGFRHFRNLRFFNQVGLKNIRLANFLGLKKLQFPVRKQLSTLQTHSILHQFGDCRRSQSIHKCIKTLKTLKPTKHVKRRHIGSGCWAPGREQNADEQCVNDWFFSTVYI